MCALSLKVHKMIADDHLLGLQGSALIEAFNLKAAVELHMGVVSAAQAALQDMPPRAETDLDPVCTPRPFHPHTSVSVE